MLALVLTNLAFVQLTGSADPVWLLPLYVATLAAPWLTRWRDSRLYRGAWNVCVVAVFGILLRHAAGYDLRYVLQDGLILAVLCQVHLLNNLREDQRPDLLFLNSFLIAVATGYLSEGLGFAGVFLLYAPLFLVGQELLCITREGSLPAGRATRQVLLQGLRHSGLLLAATLLVFVFWPRDFHRKGLIGSIDFSAPTAGAKVSFSNMLNSDDNPAAQASDEAVVRVTLVDGDSGDVSALWRGATLDTTDGAEWWSASDRGESVVSRWDSAWLRTTTELERELPGPRTARLEVEVLDGAGARFFTPLEAVQLRFDDPRDLALVRARPDATLGWAPSDLPFDPPIYTLELGPAAMSTRPGPPPRVSEERFVALPMRVRLRRARALALHLAPDGQAADQYAIVDRFRRYLEQNYVYTSPGAPGSAHNLDEFLAGRGAGHCEFFAAALASMLRSRGIACRIATGYRSTDWQGSQLTLRSRDAHAWVEVLDPHGYWYAVDVQPLRSNVVAEKKASPLRAFLGRTWRRLTDFDAERRTAAFAWIRALPGRVSASVREHPLRAAAVLALSVACALTAIHRRRRTRPAATRAYLAALRKHGLSAEAGETPRELLQRARTLVSPGTDLATLTAATHAHERARYRPTA